LRSLHRGECAVQRYGSSTSRHRLNRRRVDQGLEVGQAATVTGPPASPLDTMPGVSVLITVFAALLLAWVTWTVGCTGIYLFDTSIGLSSGWMLLNGWVPHRDFSTPLMPLDGILVALSYVLLGVRYTSTVIAAGVLSIATFLIVQQNMRRLVGFPIATLAALSGTMTTLPEFGALFYNYMIAAALLVYGALALALISREGAPLRIGIGITLALVLATKLHAGIAFLGLHCGLEVLLSLRGDRDVRHLARHLLMVVSPVAAVLFAAIVWAGGPTALFGEVLAPQIDSSRYAIRGNLLVFMGMQGRSSSIWPVSPLLMLLLLGQAALMWRKAGTPRLPLLFTAAMLVGIAVVTLPSADSSNARSFAFVIPLVAIVQAAPAEHRRIATGLVAALLAWLLVYATGYALRLERKAWDDVAFAVTGPPPATERVAVPFFTGMTVSAEHAAVLRKIEALHRAKPGARILFGPGMEALAPAFGQLPPRRWPNWFHRGLSYQVDAADGYRAAFLAARYDYVLLADRRDPILLPALAGRYRATAHIGGFTTLYQRID